MTKAPGLGSPAGRRPRLKPLADLVSELVDPIMARKAGMTSALVSAWPEICGPRLQDGCRPEKLLWHARRSDNDPFEPATLVVACEGAAALRLQHQTAEVLQRVNAFFGYHAVARLKIVQRPVHRASVSRKPKLRRLDAREVEAVRTATASIEDDRLRAALEALGRAVRERAGTPSKLSDD